jgi:hypothetical protein
MEKANQRNYSKFKKLEGLFLTLSSDTFWQHAISEFNAASASTSNEFY